MDKPPKRIAKTNAEKAMLTVDSTLVNLWSTACNNKNVGGSEGSVKLHPHFHDLTPLGRFRITSGKSVMPQISMTGVYFEAVQIDSQGSIWAASFVLIEKVEEIL